MRFPRGQTTRDGASSPLHMYLLSILQIQDYSYLYYSISHMLLHQIRGIVNTECILWWEKLEEFGAWEYLQFSWGYVHIMWQQTTSTITFHLREADDTSHPTCPIVHCKVNHSVSFLHPSCNTKQVSQTEVHVTF